MNKELRHIKKWLDAKNLSLNVDKTNFVLFHSPQNSLNDIINIKIGNQYVKQAKYVKFLGPGRKRGNRGNRGNRGKYNLYSKRDKKGLIAKDVFYFSE